MGRKRKPDDGRSAKYFSENYLRCKHKEWEVLSLVESDGKLIAYLCCNGCGTLGMKIGEPNSFYTTVGFKEAMERMKKK